MKLALRDIQNEIVKRSELAREIAEKNFDGNYLLTADEVKYVYGSKGGLRLVLELDREKKSSKYKKVCEKISSDYKTLKMESRLAALKQVSYDVECFAARRDGLFFAKETDEQLKKIMAVLEDERFKSYTTLKNKLKSLKKAHRDLKDLMHTLNLSISLASLLAQPFLALHLCIGAISTGIADIIIVTKADSKNKEFKAFMESGDGKGFRKNLGEALKNLKGLTQYLNVLHDYSEIYRDNRDGYEKFVNGCGSLAYKYLKAESSSKMKIIKKYNEHLDKLSREDVDKANIGKYKLLFMALICMCSKKADHQKYGNDIYNKVIPYI